MEVTKLLFMTGRVVDASNFINSMIQEGPNNHKIAEAGFHNPNLLEPDSDFIDGISSSHIQGSVVFVRPLTQDLRSWIDEHARGKGIHIISLEFDVEAAEKIKSATARATA
jgi:hypothetical protein